MVVLTSLSCAKWKKKASTLTAVSPRVSKSQSLADPPSLWIELDEKSGRPRGNVILRRDYFPPAAAGQMRLPACLASLPDSFELGTVVCDQPKGSAPSRLLGRQVEQDCYTDPTEARIPAKEVLTMPGCKKAAVFLHAFEPKLQLDIEIRELN